MLFGHLSDVRATAAGKPQQILRHLLVERLRAFNLWRLLNIDISALSRV